MPRFRAGTSRLVLVAQPAPQGADILVFARRQGPCDYRPPSLPRSHRLSSRRCRCGRLSTTNRLWSARNVCVWWRAGYSLTSNREECVCIREECSVGTEASLCLVWDTRLRLNADVFIWGMGHLRNVLCTLGGELCSWVCHRVAIHIGDC